MSAEVMSTEAKRTVPTTDFLPTIGEYNGIPFFQVLQAVSVSNSHYLIITPVPFTNSENDEEILRLRSSNTYEIRHTAAIINIKSMPHYPKTVAALDVNGTLSLWFLNKPPSDSGNPKTVNYVCDPNIPLRVTGNAICWNPRSRFKLLIPSQDGRILTWDDINFPGHNLIYDPPNRYLAGSWSNENIFGTADYNGLCKIWDTRLATHCLWTTAHDGCATTIDFSPFTSEIFITGGIDGTVAQWDKRNLSRCLFKHPVRSTTIFKVLWSPHVRDMFAVADGETDPFLAAITSDGNLNNLVGLIGPRGSVYDMTWHPAQKETLIYVVENGAPFIWDMVDLWSGAYWQSVDFSQFFDI